MRRVLQPHLSRGHLADRLATLLFLGLLAVLAIAVYNGVKSLPLY